jgi:PAS domain S-box-containing protein
VKYVHNLGHPVLNNAGELVEYIGTTMDVTEQVKARTALEEAFSKIKQSEASLRMIIDTIPALAWSTEADGSVEFVNRRWSNYTGLATEQARGSGWQAAIHPEDLGWLSDQRRIAMASGKPFELEARMRRYDGQYRWFINRADPLIDEQGRILKWYGTNTDIDDRKRAEEALRRSENYLAEAQKLSHTGSWAFNILTGELVHSSEEHRRLFGFDPEKGIPSFDELVARIHPEDRPLALREFETATPSGKDFDAHFRIVLPDGSTKYVYGTGHPVFNPSGDIREFIGTVVDVTERKRAEMEAQAHLWFLKSMDRINRAIQGANDLEEMMSEVLKAVLSIFDCDRAWLVYPCDPQAPTWRAVMEHVRPEFPGAFALGVELPLNPEVANVFGRARGSRGSVCFGPDSDDPVPSQLAERFKIRSMIGLALYPKLDKPYMFGLHECTHPRVWNLARAAVVPGNRSKDGGRFECVADVSQPST